MSKRQDDGLMPRRRRRWRWSRWEPDDGRRATAKRGRSDPWLRALLSASSGYDATQLMVAVDRRVGRRPHVLARVVACADRNPARLRRDLHRQQRSRTWPSRSRRLHGAPTWLGTPDFRRRRPCCMDQPGGRSDPMPSWSHAVRT
jgi:hypothetical protein